MSDLLRFVPRSLLHDLVDGRWLPLIGAGLSRNAVVPTGDPPVNWIDLGRKVALDLDGVEATAGPLEALSAYEHAFGRTDLVDRVAELVRVHDAQPGAVHLAFARMGFTDVVTTNFDYLLERAYDAVGKRCLPLVDEVQLSTPNRYPGPRLIKMHGDTHHPSRLVITEDDYDQFLHAYPLLATSITAMLVDRTAMLVGYSLEDPDTRHLLSLIKRRLGRLARPLWTIQVDAPAHLVARFERRGVKVINLPAVRGRSFGDQLEQLFVELGQYWRDKLSTSATSTDDRVSADLVLPEQPSRICFFAIPSSLVGWYRDVVFPVVERNGMIPVTARDVVSPPGTTPTKLDALIDRAAVVVVELGNSWGDYEASVALARKESGLVALVAEDGAKLPAAYQNLSVLSRPRELEADPEWFVRSVEHWLSNHRRGPERDSQEPERLLRLREFNAALISATALLESSLADLARRRDVDLTRAPSLRMLLRQAVEFGVFESSEELARVEEAVSLRNEALHRGRKITGPEARRAVKAIRQVVNRLD